MNTHFFALTAKRFPPGYEVANVRKVWIFDVGKSLSKLINEPAAIDNICSKSTIITMF